jgi:molybdopterin molybdotransferase
VQLSLITPADARELVVEHATPITGSETLPLLRAAGRIAATNAHATQPLPRFDHAAVDGYGLGQPGGGPGYRIVSEITAGRGARLTLRPGEAVRLATGAPVPPGVTGVVMHEVCHVQGDKVFISGPTPSRLNIRRRGEDVADGDLLIEAGSLIDPRHIAALAATGIDHIAVRRRLRVAVLSTGDELRRAGQSVAPFQIYDSNGPMLLARLQQPWIESIDGGICRDDRTALGAALAELSSDADLILASGGAGGSATDLMVDALRQAGGSARALRIAQRPGKPLVVGVVDQVPVLGLPGNGVAALVSFLLYGEPMMRARAQLASSSPWFETATLHDAFTHPPGRTDFVLSAVANRFRDGPPIIEPIPNAGSASLGALLKADGLMEVPHDVACLAAGSRVRFLPFHMADRPMRLDPQARSSELDDGKETRCGFEVSRSDAAQETVEAYAPE